jgi:lipoyl(octanoyl) transferase
MNINFNDIENRIDLEHSIDSAIDLIKKNNNQSLNFFWLGKCSYNPTWILQKTLHELRVNNKINDTILLLEHEHVYTLGKNADENHILPSKPEDTEVVRIDRGGDVTYHGPGQLVGYPIIDLNNYRKSITWYMGLLSDSIIDLLSDMDIKGCYKKDYIGVWVDEEKIAAFGVRLAKWTTMHGFALNINTNLDYFEGMIPCGIFQYGVTSINKITNKKFKISEIARKYSNYFIKHLNKKVEYETS